MKLSKYYQDKSDNEVDLKILETIVSCEKFLEGTSVSLAGSTAAILSVASLSSPHSENELLLEDSNQLFMKI